MMSSSIPLHVASSESTLVSYFFLTSMNDHEEFKAQNAKLHDMKLAFIQKHFPSAQWDLVKGELDELIYQARLVEVNATAPYPVK